MTTAQTTKSTSRLINLRNYRERNRQNGWRRLDVLLTPEEWAILQAVQAPGESFSETIGRLVEAGFRKPQAKSMG